MNGKMETWKLEIWSVLNTESRKGRTRGGFYRRLNDFGDRRRFLEDLRERLTTVDAAQTATGEREAG